MKIKYLIVRTNSTSGPWKVERDYMSTYSIADIDRRRWNKKESAQKAADKRNEAEQKRKKRD
jgi:hypothetical protein